MFILLAPKADPKFKTYPLQTVRAKILKNNAEIVEPIPILLISKEDFKISSAPLSNSKPRKSILLITHRQPDPERVNPWYILVNNIKNDFEIGFTFATQNKIIEKWGGKVWVYVSKWGRRCWKRMCKVWSSMRVNLKNGQLNSIFRLVILRGSTRNLARLSGNRVGI